MASELPPKFDDADRAITPMESFDSRPKLQIAEAVAGVTRLRPPTNVGHATALELRDTDHDELTPPERPFEIRVELRLTRLEQLAKKQGAKLGVIRRTSRRAAQRALETHALVKSMDERMRRFEQASKWAQRLGWIAPTLIALWALFRTFH